MLADNTKPKVILDVRNGYEWDLGRFEGAERPSLDHFTETDEAAYKLPTDEHDKEETPVMMYCTGGIRCEIFSAKLKASGFKHVYKLQGGVQHYGNTFAAKQKAQAPAGATAKESVRDGAGAGDHGGTTAAPVSSDAKKEEQEQAAASAAAALKSSSKDAQGSVSPFWKGSLFVFDRRNKMDMGSDEVVGTCLHCGGATDAIFNCGNVDCNKMHLVCHNCLPQSQGYCSQECSVAPRRRPLPLADLLAEGQVTAEVVASLTQGPPPGMRDPNKLSTTKPHCIPRKDFNADIHGFQ
uniref:Rhodanese domain-containing protein n=2 Tax=Chrysotila carterae TaxID=13221 RepID=A0A7S4EXF0_CHRCT